MIADTTRRTFTVTEVGAILGIGRSSVYAAINRGEIPALTIGRRKLISRSVLAALLQEEADRELRGGP